ncbi:hypothetical protein BDK51DRAFT_30813 [Blyttiomyces helicus]|uniref:Cyclic nucleotide-binding domain-containing protein n=1 Tax=Blyttiomyces helicus TaxID=388810 RepID=A0A4V1IST5_9FUNG|nr:hypothetical protein BDK51DRAFT_30813 [Blyttiomyces helicus]|eukprot:RKO94677.1 hypothetical protein BDK51DRAFT_30813 [Blyttiomyces helicus]
MNQRILKAAFLKIRKIRIKWPSDLASLGFGPDDQRLFTVGQRVVDYGGQSPVYPARYLQKTKSFGLTTVQIARVGSYDCSIYFNRKSMDVRFIAGRPLMLAPLGTAPNLTVHPPPNSLTPSQLSDAVPSSTSNAPSNAPAGEHSENDPDSYAELVVYELKIRSLTIESDRLANELESLDLVVLEKRAALIGSYQKKHEAIGAAAQIRKRLKLSTAMESGESSSNLGKLRNGGTGSGEIPLEASCVSAKLQRRGADDNRVHQIPAGLQLDVSMQYFSDSNLRDSTGLSENGRKRGLISKTRTLIESLKSHQVSNIDRSGRQNLTRASASRKSTLTGTASRKSTFTGSASRKSSKKSNIVYPQASVMSLQREAAVQGINSRYGSQTFGPLNTSPSAESPANCRPMTKRHPADGGPLNLMSPTTLGLSSIPLSPTGLCADEVVTGNIAQLPVQRMVPSSQGEKSSDEYDADYLRSSQQIGSIGSIESRANSYWGQPFDLPLIWGSAQSGKRFKRSLALSSPFPRTSETSEGRPSTPSNLDGGLMPVVSTSVELPATPALENVRLSDEGDLPNHPHQVSVPLIQAGYCLTTWNLLITSEVAPPVPMSIGDEYGSATESLHSSLGKHVKISIAMPNFIQDSTETSESSFTTPPPPALSTNVAKPKWWADESSRVELDNRRISVIRALPSKAADTADNLSIFPLHPMSRLALIWNAVLMMIVGSSLLLMPLALGFTENRNLLPVMSAISASFYAIGIWLNFHIGYIQGDIIYMESRTIVQKYFLRGDFFLDLLLMGNDRSGWGRTVTRYLAIHTGLNSAFVSAISVFTYILLYWHWGACIRNFFDVIDDTVPPTSPFERYTTGFYSSASETLSAGFGADPPDSTYRRWFGVLNIIISATFEAVLVGNVSTFMIRLDWWVLTICFLTPTKVARRPNVTLLAYKGFSASLRSRIIEFYEFKYSGGKYFNEKAILRELSGPLRRLSLVLEERHFLDDDLIMQEGDEAEEMYFIWTGTCAVSIQGTVRLQLHAGAFFGEIALLFSGMRRTATITAVKPCILYSLSKQNLDAVLERFEDVAETVAEERLANFGKAAGTGGPPPPPQNPAPVHKVHVFTSAPIEEDEDDEDVWKSLE